MIDIFDNLYNVFKDSPSEKICLVETDGTVHEVPNNTTGKRSSVHFEIKDIKSIKLMMQLYSKGRLAAIAHNHPRNRAVPSITDVYNHNRPILMIIYSNITDSFGVYRPNTIKDLLDKHRKIEVDNQLEHYTLMNNKDRKEI